MKKNYSQIFFAFLVLTTAPAMAQSWVSKMQDPSANFYDVQKAFTAAVVANPSMATDKGTGYKVYKRWENFTAPRVYPNGNRAVIAQSMSEYQSTVSSNTTQFNKNGSNSVQAANWSLIGPNVVPLQGGAGRLNFVRFHPSSSTTMFTGSPSGGLWKSTNGGTSWTTNTDNLGVVGCSDIVIDPSNTNIMYLATGDGEVNDTYSIGVLKSIDAGATWSATNLSWAITQTRIISKLLINPSSTSTLLAATSNGVYRTTNGGTLWTQVLAVNSKDIEFKPGDPTTVYAVSTGPPSNFYRSTDGGATWTVVTTGLPVANTSCRLAIAVTPADVNYVYVVSSLASNYKYQGVYRSVNSGTSFTTSSTTPDILSVTTTSTSGQGWYDLSIAASPTNKNEIVVAGVNIWKSTDGGVNWALNAHWQGSGAPYVHADIHALEYAPGSGSTIWAGSDGGLFKTTDGGASWNDFSTTMAIAQLYRLGLSKQNTTNMLAGWQDNGTSLYNGTWYSIFGGDGMECIIDHTNPLNVYAEIYYGKIYKSGDGGATFGTTPIVNTTTSGVHGVGDWVTPYVMDPNNSNNLLVGKTQVYKSTNGGTSWAQVGSVTGGTGGLIALAYAPSNSNYIYAAKVNKLYVSTNGTSFTDLTGTLPVGSAAITYIAVSNANPSKAWVTFSGYSAANKVFATTDAGVTWTNVSTGVPNLPVNCVVYQNGSNDGVYVGTDVGVYYKDNTSGNWAAYNTGLPNVIVNELEIQYTAGKLRAATYGRGIWESNLMAAAPTALFTAGATTVCAGKTITFTDQSTGGANTWSWTFAGGTPGTSTSQNPTITYNTPGVYNVTLVASNTNGSSTNTKTNYVTVNAKPTASAGSNVTICKLNYTQLTATGGTSYTWTPATGLSSTVVSNPNAAPTATTTYTVTVSNTAGCTATAAVTVTVNPCVGIEEAVTEGSFYIYPNPNEGKFTLNFGVQIRDNYKIEIRNTLGQLVFSESLNSYSGNYSKPVDISMHGKGMYIISITNADNESLKKVLVY